MVRRGDDDRVNVRPFDQSAIVAKWLGRGSGNLSGILEVVAANVADGYDLLVGILLGGSQQRCASIADSNESQAHAVVGTSNAPVREGCEGGGPSECSARCHRSSDCLNALIALCRGPAPFTCIGLCIRGVGDWACRRKIRFSVPRTLSGNGYSRGYRNYERFCRGLLEVRAAQVRGRLYDGPGYPLLVVPGKDVLAKGTSHPMEDSRRSGAVRRPPEFDVSNSEWDSVRGQLISFDHPEASLPAADNLEGFQPGQGNLYWCWLWSTAGRRSLGSTSAGRIASSTVGSTLTASVRSSLPRVRRSPKGHRQPLIAGFGSVACH